MYVAIAGKQIKGNIVFKFNKNKQRNRNTKKNPSSASSTRASKVPNLFCNCMYRYRFLIIRNPKNIKLFYQLNYKIFYIGPWNWII